MTSSPTTDATRATSRSRELEQLVNGIPTSDGAGVKLLRVLTQNLQRRLDPFLMLDEFRSDDPADYIAGFPDHPHRGFETVTYMLAGNLRHRDSAGNEGLLSAGGVQWMTAGRGLIHSELPEQEQGLMHGFQLWLNLPARDKLCAPWYRDISAGEIPQVDLEGGAHAKVIAGILKGTPGAMQRDGTEPLYLDLQLDAGALVQLPLPATHNGFVYVYRGELKVGSLARPVGQQQMGILNTAADADRVVLQAEQPCSFLLIAGKPLQEPIAQWGPFVMNTPDEVQQAIIDYRNGRLGGS